MTTALSDRFRRNEHIVTREILGETLLIPISTEMADMDNIFALNDTGAHIWHRLDGLVTLAGIRESVMGEFAVAEEQAWSDIAALVEELADAGLIEKVG
ncbi:MAG: hypothetical protein ACI9DC_000141 [Gammaproteobacteria bacterium]|jgi:hypothetical protein